VSRWICPRCDREFGRHRQAHTCVPGTTVDGTFAGRPPWQRAIYDRIEAHLATLGPLHVDAVSVGVFLKNQDKFAEVRPMVRAVTLWLVLPRRVEHPRVSRILPLSPGRTGHIVKLTQPSDVDEEVTAWLTEAYLAGT
jgi:hypothetical protein